MFAEGVHKFAAVVTGAIGDVSGEDRWVVALCREDGADGAVFVNDLCEQAIA